MTLTMIPDLNTKDTRPLEDRDSKSCFKLCSIESLSLHYSHPNTDDSSNQDGIVRLRTELHLMKASD